MLRRLIRSFFAVIGVWITAGIAGLALARASAVLAPGPDVFLSKATLAGLSVWAVGGLLGTVFVLRKQGRVEAQQGVPADGPGTARSS
jgi:hypothetical protein